jgi:hypothetical protein
MEILSVAEAGDPGRLGWLRFDRCTRKIKKRGHRPHPQKNFQFYPQIEHPIPAEEIFLPANE